MSNEPTTPRTEQIIQFIYRMREPDIIRPDEESSLRHLLSLHAAEARATAPQGIDDEWMRGDWMQTHTGLPAVDAERLGRAISNLADAEPYDLGYTRECVRLGHDAAAEYARLDQQATPSEPDQ